MPDMTNISDFDPATGRTTTTLVATHDRSPKEEAARDGQEHDTWHRFDMDPEGEPPPAPVLTSLTPNSVSTAAGIATLALAGSGFASPMYGSANGISQPTVVNSPTSATMTYTPGAPGTYNIKVTVNSVQSNTLPMTVVA